MTKEYHISVIPGDGTGPEVVAEGIKILQTLADKFDFKLNFTYYDIGGEHYKATGEILPENILESIAESNAIYLGAIGHPDVKPGILEKGILLKLRFYFDQYINLRPVKLYEGVETPLKDKGPSDIDFVVVRENTEGLYAGAGGCLKHGTADEVAIQESINTRKGVERCIRYAFEYCRKRNQRKKLTLCGKTNVLTFAFELWERTFYEVAKEYPDIETDYAHVDAICMWMVKNPEWFDVIVTDNMFGDIITDLGAMIQGGMGIAAGANINPEGISMFEPIGGSAPKYTGKNIINPIAAISAAQIMLETIGEPMAASLIEESVIRVLRDDLKDVAAGKMGYSTQEVGDLVISYIKGNSKQ
ncbi:MAG: 3-isopropylmalate dehydrogenase [Desulfobacteraceae bacterium]|jgi:3-isopropylmalate dehydrogenase|nr:3-isopropylmalate dehydrogenase [Desulfobacteraceae bacterium]MDH3722993.1 3-isopropylmalate dehydrogenase [Desulfobacteraceae bacterium]MDH3837514.1 3-isopropylmalate dehydrogenase [Desulfobacteraceae bacterium]MDH3873286.1 3-isopropylmalate dehydrogenase [Desulfobacteraceae bacterium]